MKQVQNDAQEGRSVNFEILKAIEFLRDVLLRSRAGACLNWLSRLWNKGSSTQFAVGSHRHGPVAGLPWGLESSLTSQRFSCVSRCKRQCVLCWSIIPPFGEAGKIVLWCMTLEMVHDRQPWPPACEAFGTLIRNWFLMRAGPPSTLSTCFW